MNKIFTLIFSICLIFIVLPSSGQGNEGSGDITLLNPIPISRSTAEKPQSKVWKHACTYWTVLPDSEGTHIWRLDGTNWSKVLTISNWTTPLADCKRVDNVTHIFLFRGGNTNSSLISVEYVPATNSYKLWSKRPSEVFVKHLRGTATIDIDSKGRMWMASNGINEVNVRWSDFPYESWSAPITLVSNITTDDIPALVAMPGKIGVFWSNQTTRRFGFRTHTDGAAPTEWSKDEVPASQSAQNVGEGMADDHVNMAVSKDGTLYCAVKTEYDKKGLPQLALLIRRPSGTWDNIYPISEHGTRPIIILNETLNTLRIVYASKEGGGDIMYKETSTSNISFGQAVTLLPGQYDNPTSTKDNYVADQVILASNASQAVGVKLATSLEPEFCAENERGYFLAYPNPFTTRATFEFKLLVEGEYQIVLYSNNGSKVATINRGTITPGIVQRYEFETTNLPHGFYMARLEAPGMNRVLKILYIE